MIKFTRGNIVGEDGIAHDIVVKAAAPNKLKDALIGGGMVMAGIAYLTYTAFRNGAKAFEWAEWQAMYDAKVVFEPPEKIFK